MQERRSTIRVDRPGRAQYCPADDLIPRDGRLTDVSERGAGLLTQETHRVGARLTLTFPLPEEEEPLTASGVVHWSDARARQGRWYPLGLEWLPMEETARHRLHTFLGRRTQDRTLKPPPVLLRAAFVLGALLAIGCVVWALALSQKNRALGDALEQRNMILRRVEQREAALDRELTSARSQLASASIAVANFGEQTQTLESEVGRLSGEVERFQQSYVQLREER